jgi:hypothetical protein
MNFMQINELVRELRVRCASTLSRGEDVAHGSGDCNGEGHLKTLRLEYNMDQIIFRHQPHVHITLLLGG